jgi:hypothetical protein
MLLSAPVSPRNPLGPRARRLSSRPAGIDPAGFNKLADDLEIDALLEKSAKPAKKSR